MILKLDKHTQEIIYGEKVVPYKLSKNSLTSTPSSVGNGTKLTFTIPGGEDLNLTGCYMDFTVSLTNADLGTPTRINIHNVAPAATQGGYKLVIGGISTPTYNYNETSNNIIADLNAHPIVKLLGFEVSTPANTDLNAGMDFDFFPTAGILWEDTGLQIQFSSSSVRDAGNIGANVLLNVSVSGVLPTSCEALVPWFREINVDIGGKKVLELSNLDILTSLIYLVDDIGNNYSWSSYKISGIERLLNGRYWVGSRRCSFPLDWLSLLSGIIPMSLYPSKNLTIYINTSYAANALILNGNEVNPGYQLDNIKFHYTSIQLPSEIKSDMRKKAATTGLLKSYDFIKGQTGTVKGSSESISIQESYSEFYNLLFALSPNSVRNDPSKSRKNCTFVRRGLTSYHIKVNSTKYPDDDISMEINNNDNIESWVNFEQAIVAGGSTLQNFVSNSYISLGYNLNLSTDRNYAYERPYVPVVPSFAGGVCISSNITKENHHPSMKSGVDVSSNGSLSLDLKGMNTSEECSIFIFSYGIGYITFRENDIVYSY